MNTTLGAPSRARTGAGHAGADSSAVLPITPGKAAPGSYSSIAIRISPASRHYAASPLSCGAVAEPASPGVDDQGQRFFTWLPYAACTCPSLPWSTDPGRDGGESVGTRTRLHARGRLTMWTPV